MIGGLNIGVGRRAIIAVWGMLVGFIDDSWLYGRNRYNAGMTEQGCGYV